MVFSTRLTADGGPDRVRTDDLLDANQALSQLSYGPIIINHGRPSALPKNLGSRRGGLESRINVGSYDPANGNVDLWSIMVVDCPFVSRWSTKTSLSTFKSALRF